jgi:hypothetical protein
VTVNGLGNPLRLPLTAGQRHAIIKAHHRTIDRAFDHPLVDRSSGAKAFVAELLASGIAVVIPPNKNANQPRA